MKKNIPELYGSLVFNNKVMKSKLPRDVYKALRKTIENGSHLDLDIANAVAVAMKEWAVENGATHFTHWFQPMTGITAEKHDSFINPVGAIQSLVKAREGKIHPAKSRALMEKMIEQAREINQKDFQEYCIHAGEYI